MASEHRKTAEFRFYEELNDFLPPAVRKTALPYRFRGTPSIKDAIEAIGVPHTEVELVVVNGESVGWDYRLRDADRVGVYPMFESIDVSPVIRLREAPLRTVRFVLDVHLGRLARLLRMLGFDAEYRRDYSDGDIVRASAREGRIVLTRDKGILKTKAVTHGYWIRSLDPKEQLREVVERFDLAGAVKPFDRCMLCNGRLSRAVREELPCPVPPRAAAAHDEFFVCPDCGKVYWKGTHYDRMKKSIRDLLRKAKLNG